MLIFFRFVEVWMKKKKKKKKKKNDVHILVWRFFHSYLNESKKKQHSVLKGNYN